MNFVIQSEHYNQFFTQFYNYENIFLRKITYPAFLKIFVAVKRVSMHPKTFKDKPNRFKWYIRTSKNKYYDPLRLHLFHNYQQS